MFTQRQNIHFHRGLCYHNGEPIGSPLGSNPYSLFREYTQARKGTLRHIDTAYLLPLFQSPTKSRNFFHFHFHEMQRVCGYFSPDLPQGLKVTLTGNLSGFQAATLERAIGALNIERLDPQKVYCIHDAYIGDYIDIDHLPTDLSIIYNALVNRELHASPTRTQVGAVYVSRRIRPENAGNSRVFVNEQELIRALTKVDIPTVYFEDLDVAAKVAMLNSDQLTVITTIGSQLANFLFRSQDADAARAIIIDHEDWVVQM